MTLKRDDDDVNNFLSQKRENEALNNFLCPVLKEEMRNKIIEIIFVNSGVSDC